MNIVPNINKLTRELTGKTQLQIIIDEFSSLNFKDKIIFCFNNLFFLSKILKKDFATGIKILCELEILKTKKKAYILHHQITDMAIAFKNKNILLNFFYLAKKYNFTPSIISYNFHHLIKFLSGFNEIPNNLEIYIDRDIVKEKFIKNFIKNNWLKFILF